MSAIIARPMSLEEQIGEEVRAHYGAGARVEELVPLAGGASRELYGFDVIDGAERHALVLRADPPGLAEPDARAREFAALRAAHEGGVPVPAPHWVIADGTGIVMQRVHGEAIARRLLRDERYATARDRLVDEVARACAALHTLPAPEGLPVMGARGAVEFVEAELDALGEPHPALELGLRWLRAHLPPERDASLVHGDLRLGNLMVDEGGLVALLDWELCHGGDGAEDLGWMCVRAWRFGADGQPALGVGGRERLLEAYAAAGGREVSLDELRFWEVLGNVRWGMICVRQAQRQTLEHYAIGRRACEPEWDLLALIGG
jgi:aminoglycoside phosphotransferase (APT) family kinase protein